MYIYKTSFKILIFFPFFSAKLYFSQGNKSSLKIVTVIHPSSIMKAFLKEFSCTYKKKKKKKPSIILPISIHAFIVKDAMEAVCVDVDFVNSILIL